MNYWKISLSVLFVSVLISHCIIKDFQSSSTTINTNIKKETRQVSSASFDLFSNSNSNVVNNDALILDLKARTKRVPLTGDLDQMKYFYQALKNSRNTKIRIAHYGDSIILGDVISEYLRENFQEKYGGEGVGFLSIASKDTKMRRSLLINFSDDWEFTSLFTRNPDNLPLGIGCNVSIPSSSSWAKFETTDFISTLGPFEMARIFYSHANTAGKVEYTFDNSKESFNLKGGDQLQEEIIDFNTPVNSLEFDFNSCQNTYAYGISMENGNGVYVDNFPITGNSGVNLVDLPMDLMRQFNGMLNYKLIILNFGVNVGSPKRGTYTFYEKKMLQVIDHLKKVFPETSILIVSCADRTVRKGGQFVTDSDIPILLAAQEKIACVGKVAYWNLFEAMGGRNSMEKWVDSAPPMALKDYRHFTHEGGNIVANLMFDAIMSCASGN